MQGTDHFSVLIEEAAFAERSLFVGAHVFEGAPATIGPTHEAYTEGWARQPHGEEPVHSHAGFGGSKGWEEGVGQC